MANALIAQGVAPIQIQNPLEAYARIAQIQQAQNQNALTQYQLQTARRGQEMENVLSRAYQTAYDPEKGTYDVNKLRGALITGGAGAKLPDIEKNISALATQRVTQQKADTELVDAKLKQSRAFLDTVDPSDPNAPAQYIAWHEANHKDPVLGPLLAARGITADQSRARIAQAIQQGPAAFAQLLNQSKLGTEKFIEMNRPTLTTQNLGAETRIMATPGLGGPSAVVPGSSASIQMSPAERKEQVTTIDVGNETITQAYDPVSKTTRIVSRQTKQLSPGESKPVTREINVGNEVITEEYDPVSRTTRVVSRRPMQLTPEQARTAGQEATAVAQTITDERGNVTLLNKFGQVIQPTAAGGAPTTLRKESKPVISQLDVGNEIITQMFDPNTQQISVLGRRPKTPTPEQQRQIDQESKVVAREVTDAAGNVTFLNKFGGVIQPTAGGAPTTLKKEQKPEIREVDTGSAIVTQLVDPNTKQITVLGSRPKTLTPEQQRQAAQERNVVAGSATDSAGNVTQFNKFGQVIQTTAPSAAGGAPTPVQLRGKPSATFEKTQAQRAQLSRDLDTAIFELRNAVKEGGLIDQSTGSGVGRAVDVGARFVGQATKGDIAIGKLKPIADLVLKLVPRFEGPQSDKDTQSYREAAGQISDPTLPREIRKAAANTIIRLMENRKGQFVSSDMAAEGTAAGGGVDTSNPLLAPARQ